MAATMEVLSAIRAAKQELRKKLRQSLSTMTDHQRKEESDKLVKKLLSSDEYRSSKRVSVYLSMPVEVQTEGILQDIFASGRVCFVPSYDSATMDMDMFRVHSVEDVRSLPKTKWNIQQPSVEDGREEALSSGGLDLIISPGLGFTKEGHRIGWGMGFYDKYFTKCISKGCHPKIIAMGYSAMRCGEIPSTAEDTKVDKSELVQSDLDLTRYDRILLYLRTRCLPPTSSGVLSIMGILQVIDVAYYFQYYSLPVLTALCTPIIKIMLSLKSVYWP